MDEKKLEEFAIKLEEALNTYRLRLQWLNSDSRRLFGVIVEKGVCLVLDCKEKDSLQFNQYRNCVLKLLREQISRIASFNIIRYLYFNLFIPTNLYLTLPILDEGAVVCAQASSLSKSKQWLCQPNR